MASEIRVDKINSLSGVGTVTLSPTGVDIAGITTAATLRATTGIVTSLTAGSLTSLGAVSGTTGTFSSNLAVSGASNTLGNTTINGGGGAGGIALTVDYSGTDIFRIVNTGEVKIVDSITHSNDSDTKIRFPAADKISFECAGEEILKIGASTTELLRISGPIDGSTQQEFGIGIAVNDEHTHPAAQITFKEYDASDSRGDLLFYTRGTNSDSAPSERLTIKFDGKIGVNINTPGTLLHQHESSSAANYHKFTNSTTGSSGTDGAYVGLDASEQFILWTQETGKIRFGVGNAERAYVDNNGHLGIADGNLVIATSGHGIDFSATGYGTGSSQTSLLDDYEEGNWSPGAEGFTISSTISARYTKVGRLVTVNAYVTAATGSGTSAVQITNLPFTQYGNSNYHYGSGRMGSAGGGTLSQNNIVFQVQQNLSKVKPYVNDGGINEGMISGQHIIFSATYEAA